MRTPELPNWLPDWRDDSAYPIAYDDWSLREWVWAFLRRNTTYQADYERFAALPTFYPGGGKTAKLSGRSASPCDDMALRYCDPPALPGETVKQYWARLDGKVIAEMPLEEHLMAKWCITSLSDPAKDDGYDILGPHIETPPYWLQIEKLIDESGHVSPMPSPDELEHVTLRFDLRYNIDKQLEIAKAWLKERLDVLERDPFLGFERMRATGHQLGNLSKYLRAFDADWAGANIHEIGTVLFPEKTSLMASDSMLQSARRAVKAGKDLVSGGYKELIKFK